MDVTAVVFRDTSTPFVSTTRRVEAPSFAGVVTSAGALHAHKGEFSKVDFATLDFGSAGDIVERLYQHPLNIEGRTDDDLIAECIARHEALTGHVWRTVETPKPHRSRG